MAVTLTSGGVSVSFGGDYQQPITGAGVLDVNFGSIVKKVPVASAIASGSLGGGNLLYFSIVSLAGGASTTIQITTSGALLDPLGNTVNFARAKALVAWLLGTGDTLSDGTTGTAATSVTLGHAASNPAFVGGAGTGWLGGTTPTVTVYNSSVVVLSANTAAGIVVTASTSDQLKINNDDGSNTAKLLLAVYGGTT